jgi:hypothetical protein
MTINVGRITHHNLHLDYMSTSYLSIKTFGISILYTNCFYEYLMKAFKDN